MSWIDQRGIGVPPRLRARIDDALGDPSRIGDGRATAACIDAADALLRDLLARESTGRDLALDLLTVDALATYAFEAAAADPSTLKTYAAAAAARFAAAGAA
jgi:hypothetical protein